MSRPLKLRAYELDAARAAPLLEHIMPIGGGEMPVEVLGWRASPKGRLHKVRADYPNGFRLRFSISKAGVPTRVHAQIKLKSVKPA